VYGKLINSQKKCQMEYRDICPIGSYNIFHLRRPDETPNMADEIPKRMRLGKHDMPHKMPT